MLPNIDQLCLFLDVDGTLIDIAGRPHEVHVPSTLKASLEHLIRACGGAVALVSGRTIADLDELFAPLRLCASGVHGAEVRLDRDGGVTGADDALVPPALADQVRALAERFPGTIVENKGFSVAIHYRLAGSVKDGIESALTRIVAESEEPHLRILPGHMVFEIKRATFNKGTAIRRFMAQEPFASRSPVFIGDDVTDQPGFEAVLEYGGHAYSVGRVFEGVSGSFPDPASVRVWLANLAESETSLA